jgi:hypothetical protein
VQRGFSGDDNVTYVDVFQIAGDRDQREQKQTFFSLSYRADAKSVALFWKQSFKVDAMIAKSFFLVPLLVYLFADFCSAGEWHTAKGDKLRILGSML